MNVFGIGLPEMAIIFVVALLIFGPKKLPEIGRTFGKTLRSFQDASREFQEEFEKEAKAVEKIATQAMEATLDPKPAEKPKIEAAKVEESSSEAPPQVVDGAEVAETIVEAAAAPETAEATAEVDA
ncbi:MAG: TatA/E family twin arginine-targeting protein translocase [Synechococcales cyanobacterium RM1_1_8]|nr:TatA/E family twin arginine-targeting protein translocase [Synechococcales cyanobacterium RM1_1_8]